MPVLKALLEEGTWSGVASPAAIGSGTVWPTFFTGTEPAAHGTHSDWCWRPEEMTLARYDSDRLTPFWKSLGDKGVKVGVLDVPFAPLIGLRDGFEVSEWGAHDTFGGRMKFAPEGLEPLLSVEIAAHPFSLDGHRGAEGLEALRKLSADCLEGARLRGELGVRLIRETAPDFSLIVFPEIHHASHKLWHTLQDSDDALSDEMERGPLVEPGIPDILREVDRQIGRLIEAAGSDAGVFIFSLHGMKAARGLPAFLETLLGAHSFSRVAGWSSQTWRERSLSVFASLKRRAPKGLKKLYHSKLPQEMTNKLAQPTMIPAYDWTRTRAFALPSDQLGWIRINLAGREAKGCVPLEGYDETCAEIEEMLRALRTQDGQPLVQDVIRTAKSPGDALSRVIPDIVIHWAEAAFNLPMRVNGLLLEAHPAAAALTGQHAPDGFCITKGIKGFNAQTVHAAELHSIITAALVSN
jgi:predicted AlkP superfamily phosphohydrolase/phosphomutase